MKLCNCKTNEKRFDKLPATAKCLQVIALLLTWMDVKKSVTILKDVKQFFVILYSWPAFGRPRPKVPNFGGGVCCSIFDQRAMKSDRKVLTWFIVEPMQVTLLLTRRQWKVTDKFEHDLKFHFLGEDICSSTFYQRAMKSDRQGSTWIIIGVYILLYF